MAGIGIRMTGARELLEDMEQLISQCPDGLNTAMKRVTKGFRDDCNAKMPESYSKGKRPFAKSWKTAYEYGSLGIIEDAEITNSAPHWHLVENGHRKFDFHGQDTGGFVPGKHYAEETRGEYEEKYPRMMSDAVKGLMEKNHL